MKSSMSLLAALAAFALPAAAVANGSCEGLNKTVQTMGQQQRDKAGLARIFDALTLLFDKSPPREDECGSLAYVINAAFNRQQTGGRKLEEDKPLDMQQAQADLAKALQDAAIQTRFESIQQEVADAGARLIYEAAALDSEGYYGARDLRVEQLKQQLN